LRPLIGITTSNYHITGKSWGYNIAPTGYIRAVAEAGGLPVLIPVAVDADTLHEIYASLDAVLVSGGVDIAPERYGAERNPATQNADPGRDEAEITLVRWAVEDDHPLLGICRGNQVLNVALGGTLIQDIPSQVNNSLRHDIGSSEPGGHHAHEVDIDANSRLAGILGATHVPVNSMHHQAVDRVAPSLQVTACAPDGIIEGLEMPNRHFILSVQWHPEEMVRVDDAMKPLFRAFVEAARERSKR
jgi:putative glutamine amidotransferase